MNVNLLGSEFAGADLSYANLKGANVANADFSFADLRFAWFQLSAATILHSTILPDWTVTELGLSDAESFVVHDIDTDVSLVLTVRGIVSVSGGGKLRMIFDADPWGSLITFEPSIPVSLGGTLKLMFADGMDVATQVGRTLHVFDWTGVSPAGQFDVTSPYAWDLSSLYSTGEVTLLRPVVAGDVDLDCTLTVLDIDRIAVAVRQGDPSILYDLNRDGQVSLDDHQYWVQDLKTTWFGDADLNGEFRGVDRRLESCPRRRNAHFRTVGPALSQPHRSI